MTRICYMISRLRPCGPVSQLYNILTFLDRKRFKPVILALSGQGKSSREDEFRDLGVEVLVLGLSGPSMLCAGKKINDIVKSKQIDIMHSQGIRPDLITASAACPGKVFTLRNYPYDDYTMKYGRFIGGPVSYLHMSVLRRMRNVVSVSGSVARLLKEKGLSAGVIPNGVDTERFRPSSDKERAELKRKAGLPEDKKVFISAGAMIKRKAPRDVVEGFLKSTVTDKAVLVMAGGGPLLAELKRKYPDRGRVIFTGETEKIEMLLRASDYFVSCSLSEGLPNSVLEAMACGLPVFLSDIEQHKEIVGGRDGAGTLFSCGDTGGMSGALRLYSGEEYDRESRIVRERAVNNYSAEKMSLAYQRLYHLIAEPPVRR